MNESSCQAVCDLTSERGSYTFNLGCYVSIGRRLAEAPSLKHLSVGILSICLAPTLSSVQTGVEE